MAQDVFVKAWRHLKKFDPLKAPFENWLSRMATNAALNHVRSEKRFREQVPISQLGQPALLNGFSERGLCPARSYGSTGNFESLHGGSLP